MKIPKYVGIVALGLLLVSNFAFALPGEGTNPPSNSLNLSDIDPLKNVTLMGLIDRIVGFAIGFIIAISVLFIIYAAYLYMFAGGDPKNVTQAKAIIQYTVIAIIIALMSQAMVKIVIELLGGTPAK
ncbi:MAG: hypothetical protein Q7S83_02480 [bacterium]|nr:hypothetical protein [bacterium]